MPFDRKTATAAVKTWVIRRLAYVSHILWWRRAATLGVRAIVFDGRDVLLVRHTYVPGWHFPGGAVDRGESAEAAVVRELREETGILCRERPILHGFYRHRTPTRRDYVACYLVRRYDRTPRPPDWEIAEIGFFPVAALPDGTTPATRTRLVEVLEAQAASEDW